MTKLGYGLVYAAYLEWLQKGRPTQDQVAAYTAKRYGRYAQDFCKAFGNPATAKPDTLARWRQSIETVLVHGQVRPATAQTINVKLAALRAFFDYLVHLQLRSSNPISALPMQRVPKRKPQPIPKAVLQERLFVALAAAEQTGIVLQDRAVLESLYGSGVRREELGMLRLRHIESHHVLFVEGGKGDKDRRTIITAPQWEALKKWCLYRIGDERTKTLAFEINDDAAFEDLRRRFPEAPVFYSPTGRPTPELEDPGHFIAARVKYWFKQIGEEGRKTHHIRHSWVTHLLDNGADPLAVQEMAGHGDLRTTVAYRGQGEETMRRAVSLHPRG
jgi:integrase/recombinase XerC